MKGKRDHNAFERYQNDEQSPRIVAMCDEGERLTAYAEELEKETEHRRKVIIEKLTEIIANRAMIRELVDGFTRYNQNVTTDCYMTLTRTFAKAKAMLTPADSGKENR